MPTLDRMPAAKRMPTTDRMPALLARPALPQLTRFVHAAPMPQHVKDQILDAALAREIDRLERTTRKNKAALPTEQAALPEPALALPEPSLTSTEPSLTLPDDPKVREVLENGGFTWLGYTPRGQEVWEYERIGRAGQPLTGKEAKRPPKYRVTSWGDLGCYCDCPYHAKAGAPDKHVQALTFMLMQHRPEKMERKSQ